ncbi:MAG: GTPase RsgA [Microthrixaceae bacterium]
MAVSAKAIMTNMDVVLVLQGLDAGVNSSRLARWVLAWESRAQPVVVLTKTDLCTPEEITPQRDLAWFAPGVPVVCVSSTGSSDSGTGN